VAHYNLGNALRENGDADGAIRHYREAIAIKPDYAEAHGNLGAILKTRGDLEGAIRHYRRVIEINPNLGLAHAALGQALRARGEFAEAQVSARRALKLSPPGHPLHQRARQLQDDIAKLLALEAKLSAILEGKARPRDTDEQLQLAQLCSRYKRRYLSAARFYQAAFAEQPLIIEKHRWEAACAVTLAGLGQGKDADKLGEEDRRGLRRQALAWLESELEALGRRWRTDPRITPLVRRALTSWQTTPDLAGVRTAEQLARLSRVERQQWQQLWAEVAELLACAGKE
jgi:hypothetical protein